MTCDATCDRRSVEPVWRSGGRSLTVLLLMAWASLSVNAAANATDFTRDIKPLLAEKCAFCHGPLEQEGGLRLDAATLIVAGSDSGAVVNREHPEQSLLLQRVTSADESLRMPPVGEGEKLTEQEVALLRQWIAGGAAVPEDEEILADPKDHWAYRPLQRPALPQVENEAWQQHPIDRFLSAQHAQRELQPVGLADRRTLLRRVSLDLIGLPPTPEEMQAFLADESPEAYGRVVDRLLASPHYGERWARHWMDIWRYSDWDGYKQEVRGSQRHIWRWRDWIIESLNADKGYDQMIREMLAADELAPDDPQVLRATGYLTRNYHNKNRDVWLDATVEHTAKAFLGITLDCARCHDHKYDPIPQEDYFRFRAFFEPHDVRTDRLPGERDLIRDGLSRVYDAWPDRETYLYAQGDERRPVKEHPIAPAIPSIFGQEIEITPIPLPPSAWSTELQDYIEQEELALLEQQLQTAQQELANLEKQLREQADSLPADEVEAVEGRTEQESSEQKKPAETQPENGGQNVAPAWQTTLAWKRAERKVVAAQLERKALAARWQADKAKWLGEEIGEKSAEQSPAPEETPAEQEQARLAREAFRLERAHAYALAEWKLLDKQHALEQHESAKTADEKDEAHEKKRAELTKELDKAREDLDKAREGLDQVKTAYKPVGKVFPQTSTGRRAALANWIASVDNPLTARVAVNHVWLRHFGKPLVPKMVDFGLSTPRPPLADLLDWLAVEFQSQPEGWSLKHLHRLIVTSRAYQLASTADGADERYAHNRQRDGENLFFWKRDPQRLEAEIVRDAVLATSGSLDRQLGGPDIDYQEGETLPRRSLYFRTAYEKQMLLLTVFDMASPNECYRRSTSVIPQQALAMANSPLTQTGSRKLARELWNQLAQQDRAEDLFVEAVFEQILNRPPTAAEQRLCRDFLAEQAQLLATPAALTPLEGGPQPQLPPADDPYLRARENLVHAIYNHNDFVTVR